MFRNLLLFVVMLLVAIPVLALGRGTIIDDFLVNDDIGTASQDYPTISVDSTGNFVITWMDERNGEVNIYAQRYNSSGTALGSNFKVNDDLGTAVKLYTSISMNNSGKFVITWNDFRNAYWDADVYAQRYNSSGTPLGSNFKVNDDAGGITQVFPAISVNNSGNFVIAWIDYRNNSSWGDIYVQRYDSSGTPLGSNFKVNDNAYAAAMHSLAVSMGGSGGFVVTWEDDRDLYSNIYAQRYNSTGTALGSNFRVNDDAGDGGRMSPAISVNGSGNFVVTWYIIRNGNSIIYAQRYNSSGTALGSNFEVNDYPGSGGVGQEGPAISMDSFGSFVIAWLDGRNDNSDIYAQRYNSSGNPVGGNYMVSNPQYALFSQREHAVAANNSNIYFTWRDDRRGNLDIYGKVVDWDWTKVEDESKENLPSSFELYQNYPNPFNPTTNIPFTVYGSKSVVHGPIHTTLKVYDILGQLVRTLVDEEKSPGNYIIIWDGKDQKGNQVSSGVYFYRVKCGEFDQSKRMVLVK